ncbi:MAG: helix-turn-helix domain-containing protein [Acidobacteriota bacterium]|nr:helix-turn-helix domain-containing protein [Acidobacteriota bacterium]
MRTLREATGKTQAEVAKTSGIDQADISRLESRESFADCQVSTLERYVAALGGRLDLVATFGDKKIGLAGARSGSSDEPLPETVPTRSGRGAARR